VKELEKSYQLPGFLLKEELEKQLAAARISLQKGKN
jgi:hypothetical protein